MSEERTPTSSGRLRATALEDDISFLLARANALALAAGNAALAEHGLRARSYSVLSLAAGDARASQRDIAEYLRLDPSQVVAIVDELEARELVRRQADPADRRANVVVATSEGRDVFARARQAALGAERELHDRIPETERDAIAAALRLLAFPD